MFLTQKPKGQVGSTMKNLKMCFLYVPSSLFVGGNNPFESEIFFFQSGFHIIYFAINCDCKFSKK